MGEGEQKNKDIKSLGEQCKKTRLNARWRNFTLNKRRNFLPTIKAPAMADLGKLMNLILEASMGVERCRLRPSPVDVRPKLMGILPQGTQM